jgi:hypothetical protein
MRRIVIFGSLAAVATLVGSGPGVQDPRQADVDEAIRKGIAWLADTQNTDGSWGCEKGEAPSTGLTGLAGLALLCNGSTPVRGPHARQIRDAVDFLLRSQHRRTGLIFAFNAMGGAVGGDVYEHACATTFLAEVYGMLREDGENDKLRDALIAAVEFLQRAQRDDGGWPSHSGGPSSLTASAMVYTALRTAANAGIPVRSSQVSDVEKFVRACYTRGGVFTDFIRGGGQGRYFPTTAGFRILVSQGRWEWDMTREAAEFLVERRMGSDYGNRLSEWCYAGLLWACQGFLQENGPYWQRWWPINRDHLLQKQNGDGSWTIEYCASCRTFATAIALMVLQSPRRNLPMWDM